MTTTPPPVVTVLPHDGQRWIVECSCGWTRLLEQDFATLTAELHAPRCHVWRAWATEQVDALPTTLGCYIPGPLRDLLDQLLGDEYSLPVLIRWLGDILDYGDDVA